MNINSIKSRFIVLDGPDGCGKSTQTAMLAEYLKNAGAEVASYRDPGSTGIGEKIRAILLDAANSRMADRTELLLYMASRAQLWHEHLEPALEEKKCVILDRWLSSTCAYQGFAGGIGTETVIDIAEHCLERVWPDLTIILDVDLKTARSRMNRDFDRMEQKDSQYHKNVRAGFCQLAELRDDIVIIDAAEDINQLHEKIINKVENFFSL